MLYIASDHGGFKLKEHLKKYLAKNKIAVTDLGPKKYVPTDDYPDYAKILGQKVSKNPLRDSGVLICRNGQGVCIVANKFANVRAATAWNVMGAKMIREHDMSNVLCLPGDYVSPHMAENILEKWLDTPYSTDPRHIRRIKKITSLEK